jgi:methylene-fatty-acyl-phospholipid synthase
LPWIRAFPFSWFRHPQYLGAALLVWGFFVVMRYPHPDWYAIPLVESVYYVFISRAERPPAVVPDVRVSAGPR